MQHWVTDALRGSKAHHEEAYSFGQRNSKSNLWIVVRLPHPLSLGTEKDVEFQIGFYNPTSRSYSLKVDWNLHKLAGQCICPIKATGFKVTPFDCALARVQVPVGTLVRGKATVSGSKRSIDCTTECRH